jgi:hypothetical protein
MSSQLARCIVLLRGVPLGALWLAEGDLVFGTLEPAPAYAAAEGELRRAAERLWNQGFLHPKPPRNRISVDALAPLAGLSFELRDEGGALLQTDMVNVVPSPRIGEPAVVVVGRKFVNAAVASLIRGDPREPGTDQPATT